jgi:hypothetical protein
VPRLVALLLVAACAEEPTTSVTRAGLGAAADLALIIPSVTPETFVALDFATVGPPPGVLATADPEPPPERPTHPVPASAIYNAMTFAGFSPGYGYAQGSHRYQGNRGRIETTARVRSEGAVIGSQSAVTEHSNPFVFDFGWLKYISAFAKVYTDIECGLTVDGFSQHRAAWQAVLGGPVSDFQPTEQASQSDVGHQPACEPPPPPPTPGGGGWGGGDPATCWFWLQYDLWTGEVYAAALLFCSGGD